MVGALLRSHPSAVPSMAPALGLHSSSHRALLQQPQPAQLPALQPARVQQQHHPRAVGALLLSLPCAVPLATSSCREPWKLRHGLPDACARSPCSNSTVACVLSQLVTPLVENTIMKRRSSHLSNSIATTNHELLRPPTSSLSHYVHETTLSDPQTQHEVAKLDASQTHFSPRVSARTKKPASARPRSAATDVVRPS